MNPKEPRRNRPPSVVWTQIVMLVFSALFLIPFIQGLLGFGASELVFYQLVYLAVLGGVIFLLQITFWGLVKRAAFGRWTGVVSLLLCWGILVLSRLRAAEGGISRFKYDNNAQLYGAITGQALIHLLMLILVLRFAFARKVTEFFRQT